MASRLFAAFLFVPTAFCQLAKPNEAGVSMGHLHVLARDIDAEKRIWLDGLGATAVTLGQNQGVKMPGAIVLFRPGAPSGGSQGSSIDHVGVLVPDVGKAVEKCASSGAKIASQNERQAMLLTPSGVRLELTLQAGMSGPVAFHHIHWRTSSVEATKAWWAQTLGAVPGKRGQFEAADIPGANLSFSQAKEAVAATKGRALDHIGFEVRDLEAFCRKLEASGVTFTVRYRKAPELGIALAFFVDPWGTNVELTEGLDRL